MQSSQGTEERPAAGAPARASVVVGTLGVTWIALHASGLLDPEAKVTFLLAGAVAVTATVVGIRRWKPVPRWPWLAVLATFVLFLIGGAIRTALGTLGDLSAGRSLVPEAIILPGYLMLALGVAGLAGMGFRDRRDLDAVLDAVVAALAVLSLAWLYLITPALGQQHVSLTVRALLAAYPVASVFVFAMVARMAFGASRRPPLAMIGILLAIFFLLVGDVIYMFVDLGTVDLPTQIIDVPYALAFVAYSCAALHPSMRRVTEPVPSNEAVPGRGRLVLVALALCVPALVLFTPMEGETTTDRVALAVIVLLLTATAASRMFRALQEHARSQEHLAHQATHDALTGMPNRLFINEHLDRTLAHERGRNRQVALIFLDLDRFALVNDTMGHGTGDELLIAVAERLRRNVRERDVVGRIGGDEFVVVITDVTDEAQAAEFAQRTRLMFKTPFHVEEADIIVSASVGVSVQPIGGGATAEMLLRDADTAMYHAKSAGGDGVACFDDSMRERVAERLLLERELRHALERGELSLHFQPKIRLSDQRLTGMEALLRWNHPTLGSIRPDLFIPIAEDTGMIIDIGAWVIDEACAELARLRQIVARPNELTVSVNVSARQLRDDAVMDHVARALLRHGVPASALCLELTESMLMENLDAITRQLESVRSCGVRISIDDFGTGYSSLAYLGKLPVDEVKIDRSFVNALSEDGAGTSLVAAVVSIAASLGMSTVAEGVEEAEQAERLAELGCHEAQGYLYSRPVPADELPDRLAELGLSSRHRLTVVSGGGLGDPSLTGNPA